MEYKMALPEIEKESARGLRNVPLITDAFSRRQIFLFGEISDQTLYEFSLQLLTLQENGEEPITICLNSIGGEVDAGLAIYDLIQSCRVPVSIYCVGMAASMGAIILAGGHKGRRYILPHSRVMIHEPLIQGGMGGSASTIKSTAESILRTKKILNGILSVHTGKSMEVIDRATEYDRFFDAKGAVKFGICDEVRESIGEGRI